MENGQKEQRGLKLADNYKFGKNNIGPTQVVAKNTSFGGLAKSSHIKDICFFFFLLSSFTFSTFQRRLKPTAQTL
jgi:hypothetical protein